MSKKETVLLGGGSWSGMLGVITTVLEAADWEGKKKAREELRRMAQVADLLPEAIKIIEAGVRMRKTPIVDNDFPAMRDQFDSAADEFLRKIK